MTPKGTSTWTSEPLRLKSVVHHSETQIHRSAAKEELDTQLASIDGGITAAFENVWEAEECAVKAALACIYLMGEFLIPQSMSLQ